MPVHSLKSSELWLIMARAWFMLLVVGLGSATALAEEPDGWSNVEPDWQTALSLSTNPFLFAEFSPPHSTSLLLRPAAPSHQLTAPPSAGWFTIASSHYATVLTSADAVFQPVASLRLSENLPGLTAFTGHAAAAPTAMPVCGVELRQPAESTSGWQQDEDIVIRGLAPEEFLVPVASRSSRAGQLLRFRADYITEGLDEFRDVARLRGNLQLTLQSRLAFDGEFNHWADPPAGHDDLWTGDANLVYVFGYGTPIRLKIGGGANWQSSSGEMDYGLNSTYGLDISIKRPFVVSGSLDIGTLNGDRVFHGQATLGALLGVLEIYAGYDWLDFGSLKMNGPVAGAGIWF